MAPPCPGLAYDKVRVRGATPQCISEEEEAVTAVDGPPGAIDFRQEVEGGGLLLADGDVRRWRRQEDRTAAAVVVEAQDEGYAQEAEAG